MYMKKVLMPKAHLSSNLISSVVHRRNANRKWYGASLLALLTGCGGGGGSSPSTMLGNSTPDDPAPEVPPKIDFASISGLATDGPLQNAFVFFDVNNNARFDEGEPSTTSDENGDFTLDNVPADGRILAITDDTTIDIVSNQAVPGLTFYADKDASVVSPVTSLMYLNNQSGTSVGQADLLTSLGLDPALDYTSNAPSGPYGSGADALVAIAAERAGQKLTTTLSAFSAALEAYQVPQDKAYEATLSALTTASQEAIRSGGNKDNILSDATFLETTLATALAKEAAAITLDDDPTFQPPSVNVASFQNIGTAVHSINQRIDDVSYLGSDFAQDIFALGQELRKDIQNLTGSADGNPITPTFDIATAFVDEAPSDITFAASQEPIPDESEAVIGILSVTDDLTSNAQDETPSGFLYEISGENVIGFRIDKFGQLLVNENVSPGTYDVTITVFDESNNTFAKEISIDVQEIFGQGQSTPTINLSGGTSFVFGGQIGGQQQIDVVINNQQIGYIFAWAEQNNSSTQPGTVSLGTTSNGVTKMVLAEENVFYTNPLVAQLLDDTIVLASEKSFRGSELTNLVVQLFDETFSPISSAVELEATYGNQRLGDIAVLNDDTIIMSYTQYDEVPTLDPKDPAPGSEIFWPHLL